MCGPIPTDPIYVILIMRFCLGCFWFSCVSASFPASVPSWSQQRPATFEWWPGPRAFSEKQVPVFFFFSADQNISSPSIKLQIPSYLSVLSVGPQSVWPPFFFPKLYLLAVNIKVLAWKFILHICVPFMYVVSVACVLFKSSLTGGPASP